MYLEREHYDIEESDNGLDALSKALNKDYAAILLDVFMPGKDGLSVLKELRLHKDTPVIILTAQGSEKDRSEGLSMGANAYLLKPFSPKDVVSTVKEVLKNKSC